jgi:DNA adenine methylase
MIIRYPGGKSKLKHTIVKQLSDQAKNKNLQYREPFFGSGSIGIKLLDDNPNITKIWINDKDIGIACLWTAIIRYHNDFKDHIYSFVPSVSSFYEYKNELIDINIMPKQRTRIVDIGFKKLAIHQISYSGLGTKSGGPLGGAEQKSQYKIDCRWSPDYICNKVDHLQDQFNSVEIYENGCTNLDFIDLIENTSCDSLLYLDPPYYIKGNDLYQHGFTIQDHKRLASVLQNTNHSWVLSYDDCQDIRKLYKWACIKSFDVNYSITASKDKETGKCLAHTKSELLITKSK